MTVNVFGRRLPATATYAIALAAALLLLLLTVAAALWQANASFELNQLVRESIERRSQYRVLLQHVTDAETGQRGYLLTGEEAYLAPYREALAVINGDLLRLQDIASRATPERAAVAAQAIDLVRRKIDELELTVGLQSRGRSNEARLIIESDSGRELMQRLRVIVDEEINIENAALAAGLDANDAAAARTRWVIVLAGALLLGIGALLLLTVRNAMSELRESRDQARAAHRQQVLEAQSREQAEAKMRQMQKMEAIGQLTGGVAHDFNNMLAVIMSALQLARRRIERGEEGAMRFIEAAIDGAQRAASLTGRLLAFARRQPLSPSVIDVNRVLGGMSDMLRRALGEAVQLETVLAGGLWRVKVDRHELEQAILNICVKRARRDGRRRQAHHRIRQRLSR